MFVHCRFFLSEGDLIQKAREAFTRVIWDFHADFSHHEDHEGHEQFNVRTGLDETFVLFAPFVV